MQLARQNPGSDHAENKDGAENHGDYESAESGSSCQCRGRHSLADELGAEIILNAAEEWLLGPMTIIRLPERYLGCVCFEHFEVFC